jgi:hypothetical protein
MSRSERNNEPSENGIRHGGEIRARKVNEGESRLIPLSERSASALYAHIERMEINISLFREHIAILERPFNDGRIDKEIEMVKNKAEMLNEIVNTTDKLLTYSREDYSLGKGSRDDLDAAINALGKAKVDFMAAKLTADQVDGRRDDASAKIQLAKDKLSSHEKILNDLRAAMLVHASIDGNFKSHVAPSFFVKRGHILGELSP